MSSEAHLALLAAPPQPTRLPADPAIEELLAEGPDAFLKIAARYPASSMCWALLAEGALSANTLSGDLTAYAFARTGYHRGVDALRRAGWHGRGPIPWEHEPNRGFLRALWALACAARRLEEQDEVERLLAFLREASEDAYTELVSTRPLDR